MEIKLITKEYSGVLQAFEWKIGPHSIKQGYSTEYSVETKTIVCGCLPRAWRFRHTLTQQSHAPVKKSSKRNEKSSE